MAEPDTKQGPAGAKQQQPGDRGTAGEKTQAQSAERQSNRARRSRGQHGETIINDDTDVTGVSSSDEHTTRRNLVEDEDNPGRYVPDGPDTGQDGPVAGGDGPFSEEVGEFLKGAQDLSPKEKRGLISALTAFLRVDPEPGPKTGKRGPTLNEHAGLQPINIDESERLTDLDDKSLGRFAKSLGVDSSDVAAAAIRQAKDWRGQHVGPRYLRVVTHQGKTHTLQLD